MQECVHPVIAAIVTKPLQLIIVSMIMEQEHSSDFFDCLIVDSFAGSKNVASRLNDLSRESRVRALYFATQQEAYDHAARTPYQMVYSNGDVGFRMFRTFQGLRGKRIAIYEEGIGTYRNDFYRGIKRLVFRASGIGTVFGGSKFADSIFVFEPKRYVQNVTDAHAKAIEIRDDIRNYIRRNIFKLNRIFGVDDAKLPDFAPHIVIYLTSWHVDERIIDEMRKIAAIICIKPHPNIKDYVCGDSDIFPLPADIPAELIISLLKDRCDRLTVFHHGSSSAHYIEENGVEFVEIARDGNFHHQNLPALSGCHIEK